MARKLKKKEEAQPQHHADEDHIAIASEQMMDTSGEDIPDIVEKISDDDDDDDGAHDDADASEASKGKRNKKVKKEKNHQQLHSMVETSIPFMDTFYQLSSEESLDERSIAARDLIQHCFLSEGGVNHKDAAYALSRLMNGLCTGRAASRQGFASCLSSFLRVAQATRLDGDGSIMEMILKEDSEKYKQDGIVHPAMIVRLKLLATTQFLPHEVNTNGNDKGPKKHGFGGKVKGIEERDHAFGRLFGISAVVRSGILGSTDFPSEVSGALHVVLHRPAVEMHSQ